jgi:thiopeptide-type bacteriocin biosynthesis protein
MIWKSWHIVPHEVEDVFLVRVLRSYLRDIVWPEPSARAFFVRYLDETGPHLRIRVKGRPSWMEDIAIPQFQTYTERKCASILESTYEPEAERFGDAANLIYAEEHFHLSTRTSIARMSRIPYVYGDAMFDTLRMHCLTMHAAGKDIEESANFFKQLRDSWVPAFIRNEDGSILGADAQVDLIETFQEQLNPQREKLTSSLSDVWLYAKQGLYDAKQPEWEGWHRGNKLLFKHLAPQLDIALPQLLHLHNNRMGIANYDEVYLCHILAEVLK